MGQVPRQQPRGPEDRWLLPVRDGHDHPSPAAARGRTSPEILALLAQCLDDGSDGLDAAASGLLRERADRLLAVLTTAGLLGPGTADRLAA
jgi:hypothetical protein